MLPPWAAAQAFSSSFCLSQFSCRVIVLLNYYHPNHQSNYYPNYYPCTITITIIIRSSCLNQFSCRVAVTTIITIGILNHNLHHHCCCCHDHNHNFCIIILIIVIIMIIIVILKITFSCCQISSELVSVLRPFKSGESRTSCCPRAFKYSQNEINQFMLYHSIMNM